MLSRRRAASVAAAGRLSRMTNRHRHRRLRRACVGAAARSLPAAHEGVSADQGSAPRR